MDDLLPNPQIITAPHFALIAGELSGDILGAALIRALRVKYPDATFSGVVGPLMQAEGCLSLAHIDVLSLMGIAEVLPAIPRLLLLRKRITQHYQRNRPTAFIGIDAPDFNLGLERLIKKSGIPTVHMVSPSVWAWRQGRVKTIAQSVDLMLCLFPFEPKFYQSHGVKAAYIGHPLADQLDASVTSAQARMSLGIPEQLTVAVLPGSRGAEVNALAIPFAQAVQQLSAEFSGLQVVTPVAKPSVRAAIEQASATFAPSVSWRLLVGQSRQAMQSADVVLLASGTATLECLLLGRPMVVAYRVSPLTAYIVRKLIKISHAALPNLLIGRLVVPELLQEDCTPQKLVEALRLLLANTAMRKAQTQAFDAVRAELRKDAGSLAASAIAELLANNCRDIAAKAH